MTSSETFFFSGLRGNDTAFSCNGTPGLDYPAIDDLGEDPFLGHDAITCGLFNGAAIVVALLADLGDFEHNLAIDHQAVADGKRHQIKPPADDIFGKDPVLQMGHLFLDRINALPGQQGHLPVPDPGMGIPGNSPVFLQEDLRHLFFDHALFFADADCFDHAHTTPLIDLITSTTLHY